MIDLKSPECIKSLAKALLNLNSETTLSENCFLDISVEWSAYLSYAEQLNENEKIVGVIMNSCTFEKNSSIKNIRKELIENKFVETVIALPSNLFDGTMISATMIVLSRNNDSIHFVNAEKVFQSLGHGKNTFDEGCIETILSACSADNSKISCIVQNPDGLDNDFSLCPMYYVKPYIENGIELESLCKQIICGLQLSTEQLADLTSDNPTEYQYFQPKNMNYGTVGCNLPYLSDVHDTYLDHQIKNHSLVFSKLGSPLKVALAEIPNGKTVIAIGRLYVFELDEDKVNPYYLRNYLETEEGQDSLKACSTGTAMPNLSLEKLKQLQIPMIPLKEQNRLVEEMVNFI